VTSRKKVRVKALGVNICEASRLTSSFLKQRQALEHTSSIYGFYLCNHLLYVLYVHLNIGVQWNPRLHYDTLPVYLVYPYNIKSLDRMAMLSNSGLR
jgi:hypothetical protein